MPNKLRVAIGIAKITTGPSYFRLDVGLQLCVGMFILFSAWMCKR